MAIALVLAAVQLLATTRPKVQQWAKANGFTILGMSSYLLRPTPFFFNLSFHAVYRVELLDQDGRQRVAWVRACLFGNHVAVKWNGTDRASVSWALIVTCLAGGLASIIVGLVSAAFLIAVGAALLASGILLLWRYKL